ncbi:unnamed protein product [Adineta steineri]|uniref:Integral membrane bound transporter domain-containing protein n=1 Tax=Adineta steineri TaxID=433720 RepID=A0A815KZI9_9BILA|nr:unnamed protein product [Adineta steineri]
MGWLRVFALVRRFYFNYNYVDSNLPYIHSLFFRRVQFSIRLVIAFLVSGFLAYGTPLKNQVSQLVFLIPLASVLVIQDTVGLTVAAAFQMLTTLVPVSIFLFIVQKIGLGYHDYVAAEIILLIVSFFIGFVGSQAQSRKIPLVMCAVFFATIVNQPIIPSTLIFQIFEVFAIGICVSVLITLIIFPAFATMDIENRVNYILLNLGEMHRLIVQSFLHQDQIDAQVLLTQVSTIEQMVFEAMSSLQTKLVFARFEPSRLLQRIFNLKRKNIIDLTLSEQENLVTSLFLHVRSMQSMVKQCHFNEYHTDLTRDIRESLLNLCSCQSIIINNITKHTLITKGEFMHYVSDLYQAHQKLSKTYRDTGFHRLEYAVISGTTIKSEDYLGHSFFLFQIHTIAKLLISVTATDKKKVVEKKRKTSLKERLIPKWSRILVALKTTIIMGVGSIFVMVPSLVTTFENGQWIFIALCMTQGDTVGGAFTTMRMRLFGTLLGAMWSYITYLAVGEQIYPTFGMLVPWILFFGYIRSLPNWNYTALVAIFTPILINLGRIAGPIPVPEGDFILLRIEENVIGIGLAIVLTLIIFPIFALDLLKENIQNTLEAFRDSVDSIRSIYNKLILDKNPTGIYFDIEKDKEVESFFAAQRNNFYQFITTQRTGIQHIAIEPTFLWINNFSSNHYTTLIEQELDICQILHTIDAALMNINEFLFIDEDEIHSVGKEFFHRFWKELLTLSSQLNGRFDMWSSYFKLSQTRYHRLFNDGIFYNKELFEIELLKQDSYLAELRQTVHRLENEHQDGVDQLLKRFIDLLIQGGTPSNFFPYKKNDQNDLIIIAISTMCFSTIKLVKSAIDLGTTIHNIFELETTHRYIPY